MISEVNFGFFVISFNFIAVNVCRNFHLISKLLFSSFEWIKTTYLLPLKMAAYRPYDIQFSVSVRKLHWTKNPVLLEFFEKMKLVQSTDLSDPVKFLSYFLLVENIEWVLKYFSHVRLTEMTILSCLKPRNYIDQTQAQLQNYCSTTANLFI